MSDRFYLFYLLKITKDGHEIKTNDEGKKELNKEVADFSSFYIRPSDI